MKDILTALSDPKIWMLTGIVVVVFQLIRFVIVVVRAKQADMLLRDSADVFCAMTLGSAAIAASGFKQEMNIIGIVAAVFALIFFFVYLRLRWLHYYMQQEVQDILDGKE